MGGAALNNLRVGNTGRKEIKKGNIYFLYIPLVKRLKSVYNLGMRKKCSVILKALVVVISMLGIVLNLIFYANDGYSFWYKRLLYFTTQSNLWIGITFLLYFILRLIEKKKGKALIGRWYYLMKYSFTVSIALTGFIFCFGLAPFAEDGYHPWTIYSLMVHVFVPALSIADFFVEESGVTFKRKEIAYSLIPPVYYLVFTIVVYLLGFDFGRGFNYPYFFLDFNSPAGFFGLAEAERPILGTAYWLVIMLMIVLIFGASLWALHPENRKARKQLKGKN